MIEAIIIASSAFVLLILILVIRALCFKPAENAFEKSEDVFVNSAAATENLAEMIKCKTVTDRNKELEDEAEFEKFKALLPKLFPNVFTNCEYEEVSDRAILIRWRGEKSESPTVLMAHYDVVGAAEEKWDKPAFLGILENGVLWGRGTLDTKATLNGILTASEELIKNGFKPKNDIYMAFGGDEEINGHGAPDIVNLFVERNITPGVVIDEGGAVVEGVFPGVKEQCALIGIAEKGMLNVEYSVSGGGGHASSPAPHTPVGKLSRACVLMENKPFKFRISAPAAKMFDKLARHSTFLYRLIFANLWLFSPVLNILTKKTGGELNAIVRTTTAFTQMEGSKGMNVIPPYAKMVSNHRIIPGETVEDVVGRIRKITQKCGVEVNVINGMNPSRISVTEGEAFERISAAISETWQGTIVSPYLMVACSDSRHWGKISDKVYRFSAMALSKEERATIHGNNERIPVATIAKTVEFYTRIIKKS